MLHGHCRHSHSVRCWLLMLSMIVVAVSGKQAGHPLVRLENTVSQPSERQPSSSLFQESARRDSRPAMVAFLDPACTEEIGGFYLPPAAKMSGDSCAKVQYRDEVAHNTMLKMGKGMSMQWICRPSDGKTLTLVAHFGRNCSQGSDDTYKLEVSNMAYATMQEGGCLPALNHGNAETEYVRILNVDQFEEWPECMLDKTHVILSGIAAGLCFLVVVYVCTYLIQTYGCRNPCSWGRTNKKQAMYANYGASMPLQGRGKGGAPYGKGKSPQADYGKGMQGKGKPAPGPLDLSVTIVGAMGLPSADKNGTSDPYCECEILNRADTTFKTPVIKKTLSCQWNHEGKLAGLTPNDQIKFTVYDEDKKDKKELLGTVNLPYQAVFPNGFTGDLKLSGGAAGEASSAMIRVTIAVN